MRGFRDLLRFLVSFILMFALLFMQICLFTNTTLLNEEFYKSKLNSTNYFELLKKDISFGFKNLSMVTSIPEEVYNNSINEDYLKKVTVNNIDNTAKYMKYKIELFENKVDSKLFTENIDKYVADYAKKNKLAVNDDLKKQTVAMSEEAAKIVSNHSVLFNISAVAKYGEFQKFRKALYFMYGKLFFSVILVAFLIALLFILNTRRLRRAFLWIGSSFVAASLVSIIPMLLALYARIPSKLAIGIDYLKSALQEFTLGYIKYLLNLGLIFFVVGIGCIIVYVVIGNNKKGVRPLDTETV